MKRKSLAIVLSILVLVGSALGQINGISGNFESKTKSGFSLFNPDQLKMRQSYSIWYSSTPRGSQSLAMYLNSIEYQISDPLKVQFNLGYLHRPSAVARNGVAALENGKILPGLSLTWKPSNKFHLRLDYRQMPGYYNPYGDDDYFNDR